MNSSKASVTVVSNALHPVHLPQTWRPSHFNETLSWHTHKKVCHFDMASGLFLHCSVIVSRWQLIHLNEVAQPAKILKKVLTSTLEGDFTTIPTELFISNCVLGHSHPVSRFRGIYVCIAVWENCFLSTWDFFPFAAVL